MNHHLLLLLGVAASAFAHPYPDERLVPRDPPLRRIFAPPGKRESLAQARRRGSDSIRVEVAWPSDGGAYRLDHAVIEHSGTPALVKRATHAATWGSYRAELREPGSNALVYVDAIGTGAGFRSVVPALSFRFPLFDHPLDLTVFAENPESGVMESVLKQTMDPRRMPVAGASREDLEIRLLRPATQAPSLVVNIYAEGYLAERRDKFWKDAQRLASTLVDGHFPGSGRFEIHGVFAPSRLTLDDGASQAPRDSFLGLYFPYDGDMIVYPTSEEKYRSAIGSLPYDYPISLVDSDQYWGVGNYNEIAGVPSDHPSFSFLLFHEFGHYFGLNEEYDDGGTELTFASGITEPWSQNITFVTDRSGLKWSALVSAETPVPTPADEWTGNGPIGDYAGGYATTSTRSHKPGFGCVMERSADFCPVCRGAIEAKVRFDLGM